MKKRKWNCPSQQPAYKKAQYDERKAKIFNLLGNKCKRCGFEDVRALQIDHIDGAGAKERRRLNGTSFLNKVLKLIDQGVYQLLCANCNWIKRSENDNEKPKGKQTFVED